MEYLQLGFCMILIQQLISSAQGNCDQSEYGGPLKCCSGKDSKCFVKVQSKRTKGQSNTICYCDPYCKFTNDCCEDYDKAHKLCKSKSYIVSSSTCCIYGLNDPNIFTSLFYFFMRNILSLNGLDRMWRSHQTSAFLIHLSPLI